MVIRVAVTLPSCFKIKHASCLRLDFGFASDSTWKKVFDETLRICCGTFTDVADKKSSQVDFARRSVCHLLPWLLNVTNTSSIGALRCAVDQKSLLTRKKQKNVCGFFRSSKSIESVAWH